MMDLKSLIFQYKQIRDAFIEAERQLHAATPGSNTAQQIITDTKKQQVVDINGLNALLKIRYLQLQESSAITLKKMKSQGIKPFEELEFQSYDETYFSISYDQDNHIIIRGDYKKNVTY
jgi:ABC-type uncharacterized transport system substrate-binding protein